MGAVIFDKRRFANTKMNTFDVIGKVNKDATSVLVKDNGVEIPLVSFTIMDTGLPYTKSEPMFIEVNFMREPAMHLLPYLKKGKEVAIRGCLRSKNYETRAGEKKQKYYINAEYIILTGQQKKEGNL